MVHLAFQMEALASLQVEKSTDRRLLRSALQRGWAVFHYSVQTLSLQADGLWATGEWLELDDSALGFSGKRTERVALSGFQQVHMRQDPPFDMRYITATYLLERLPSGTKVFNPPAILRNYSEKLLPLEFPEAIPPYTVSEDIRTIEVFARTHGDIILKPLYAFGGQDVFRIKPNDSNLIPAFDLLRRTYGAPVLAQAFIPDVREGDRRVIVIGGEVIGSFLRRPAEGQHRANLAAGGSLAKTSLNAVQRQRAETIARWMRERGVLLAGIDMIGDYVTEINITSPMGFAQLDTLYGIRAEDAYWAEAERLSAA